MMTQRFKPSGTLRRVTACSTSRSRLDYTTRVRSTSESRSSHDGEENVFYFQHPETKKTTEARGQAHASSQVGSARDEAGSSLIEGPGSRNQEEASVPITDKAGPFMHQAFDPHRRQRQQIAVKWFFNDKDITVTAGSAPPPQLQQGRSTRRRSATLTQSLTYFRV